MKSLRLTDWADISAILSTIAVVVSLVFVAQQIKDNTLALQSQNERELVTALQELEMSRVVDEDLAEILLRAREGQRLDAVDKYRIETLVELYLNNWEAALHDYTNGLMDPEIWHALDRWLSDKARQPYFRDVVRAAAEGNTYSDLFEEHLRDVVLKRLEDETT